jgi:hypothetical protein
MNRLSICWAIGGALFGCGGPLVGEQQAGISLADPVSSEEFPATAGLRYADVTVGVTCSGTLVAPRWILTAAHCARGAAGVEVGGEDPGQWQVLLGDDNLNEAPDPEPYRVKAIHIHPDWETQALYLGRGDLALFELEQEVAGIDPAPLAREPLTAGTELMLVGFGRAVAMPQDESELSGILRAGSNVTMACDEVPFDDQRPAIEDRYALCVDSANGPGSCSRDSGGPAYQASGSGYAVAGVVSGGRNSALGACGQYSVFTGVPQNLAFLDRYLDGAGAPRAGGNSAVPGVMEGCSTTGAAPGWAFSLVLLGWVILARATRRPSSRPADTWSSSR